MKRVIDALLVFILSIIGMNSLCAAPLTEVNIVWNAEVAGKPSPKKILKLHLDKMTPFNERFATGSGQLVIIPKKMGQGYLLIVKAFTSGGAQAIDEVQVIAHPGIETMIEVPKFAEKLGLKSSLKYRLVVQ